MSLPLVLVPVFNAVEALDACLGSLARTLPAQAEVWLVDDASTDPSIEPLARAWCARGPWSGRYLRRERRLGWTASCNEALAELDGRDAVLFSCQARATGGWLERLAEAVAGDARVATAMPWSNHGEFASFPRGGEFNPVPEDGDELAAAAAGMATEELPELPASLGVCQFLRGSAWRELGGLDAGTFPGQVGADCDFSRRAAAMGWRNVLAPNAFVVNADPAPIDARGDTLHRLLARWPDFHEAVARFLLSDPLRGHREALVERRRRLASAGPQRDLFA